MPRILLDPGCLGLYWFPGKGPCARGRLETGIDRMDRAVESMHEYREP
jgi:hypothetical protein